MNTKVVLLFLILGLGVASGILFWMKRKPVETPTDTRSENWQWKNEWEHEPIVTPPASTEPKTVGPKTLKAQSFSQAVEISGKEGRPVLVMFTADWCVWCKKMKQETFPSVEVQSVLQNYIFVEVDADQETAIRDKFSVGGLPTCLVTNGREEKLKSTEGYQSAEEFSAWLNDSKLFQQPKNVVPPEMPSQPEEKPRRRLFPFRNEKI